MIFIDLGGTKTRILFNSKKLFNYFVDVFGEDFLIKNEKKKIIVFYSSLLKTKQKFFDFLEIFKQLNTKIFMAFPEPIYNGKIYSQKFPFLNELEVEKLKDFGVDFVVNDLKAFCYYHSSKFFSKKQNQDKILLTIQIGTGVNGVPLNYWDFKNLNFLNRIYELGHIVFDYKGKSCKCGREGCSELYISGSYLNKKTNNKVELIKHIPSMEKEYYNKLCYFLSSLIIITGSSKIIIGGGVANLLDKEKIKENIKQLFPYKIDYDFEIELDKNDFSVLEGLKGLSKKIFKYF